MTFQLTATEPDAEAKGLQRRTTFKNGKKTSPPPDWATIRLGHAWHCNRRNKRCVTLLAKIDPETPEGMLPEP